jgi:hypothetical protein
VSDETKHSAAEQLAAVAVAFPVGLAVTWVRALVLIAYADWFVRPLWPSMPIVSAPIAMGLLLFPQVSVRTGADKGSKSENPWARVANGAVESLFGSGFLALFGWIIARMVTP